MISTDLKIPVLKGLVLAGGKSSRLGIDKSSIVWYNDEQQFHIANLLSQFCDSVYISKKENTFLKSVFPVITDSYEVKGPYGGILSAFKEFPGNAWLVIACDLPLIDSNALKELIDKRDSHSMATAYESPIDGCPEPLASIWEPKSYHILLDFLQQGYTCPRKVLMKNLITLLRPSQPSWLKNVNTQEDMTEVKKLLSEKHEFYGS